MTSTFLWSPVRPGASLLEVVGSGAVGAAPLPDDPPKGPSGLNWAPGALAGVLSQHARPRSTTVPATDQVLAVLTIHQQRRLTRADLERMYVLLADGPSDVSQLTAQAVLATSREYGSEEKRLAALGHGVAEIAAWLLDTGTDRLPVATGIALAGLLSDLAGRVEAIATLGRHAVFALEATRALTQLGDRATDRLLVLAKEHTGWGRIHAVEALVNLPRPDVRRWLLTTGFRNDVTPGYLALLVARACDLAGFLAALRRLPTGLAPDDVPALDGARDLLTSLLEPYGPAGDIADYAGAGQATALWFELTERRQERPTNVADLAFAARMSAAVLDDDRLGEDNGFTADRRELVADMAIRLLSTSNAADQVRRVLAAGSANEFSSALHVSRALGIDPFDAFPGRLRTDPNDTILWYQATQFWANHSAELLTLAATLLPRDGVATEARATIGPAPGPHMGVTHVLQQVIPRTPGEGWPWLSRLLGSPQAGIRWQTLTALQSWPRAVWPADALTLLRQVRDRETDEKLRARFDAVFAGETGDAR